MIINIANNQIYHKNENIYLNILNDIILKLKVLPNLEIKIENVELLINENLFIQYFKIGKYNIQNYSAFRKNYNSIFLTNEKFNSFSDLVNCIKNRTILKNFTNFLNYYNILLKKNKININRFYTNELGLANGLSKKDVIDINDELFPIENLGNYLILNCLNISNNKENLFININNDREVILSNISFNSNLNNHINCCGLAYMNLENLLTEKEINNKNKLLIFKDFVNYFLFISNTTNVKNIIVNFNHLSYYRINRRMHNIEFIYKKELINYICDNISYSEKINDNNILIKH